MERFAFLVAGLAAILISPIVCQAAPFTQQLSSDGYTLTWELSPTGALKPDTITVKLEYPGIAWLGFGWHKFGAGNDLRMLDADIVVCLFDGTTGKLVAVNDMYGTVSAGPPTLDTSLGGANHIEAFNGTQYELAGAGGLKTALSVCTFVRRLNTSDSVADNAIQDGLTNIIWAHGNPNAADPNVFAVHGPNARGTLNVDFFAGSSTDSVNSLPPWHGALMVFAYALCMWFGAFVARYLKQYYWWFPLHIGLQVAALVAAMAGFVVALIMVQGAHFRSVHTWFGLATLGLSFLTPVLGVFAHLLYDPRRSSVPVWPDSLHCWSGRLTLLLSIPTIVLGMIKLKLSTAWIVSVSMTAGGWLLVHLFVDGYRHFSARDLIEYTHM